MVAAAAWFGLAVQFDATLGATGSALAALWILLRYFTILVALGVALAFTALALRRHPLPAAPMGGIALNAALVAIVYRALIAGTLVQTAQEKLADLFLHGIAPALVVLFWLLCVPRGGLHPRDVGPWAAAPLLYFAYALARGRRRRDLPLRVHRRGPHRLGRHGGERRADRGGIPGGGVRAGVGRPAVGGAGLTGRDHAASRSSSASKSKRH